MAAAGRLVKVKQQLRSCAFRKVLTNEFQYNKKTEKEDVMLVDWQAVIKYFVFCVQNW